jgi:nucleotide-binding universal stress UspA family protein
MSRWKEADVYNTILVPLDGSSRGEGILPPVQDLAMACGATVVLLQVVEPQALGVGLEGAPAMMQQELERHTQQAESYLAALREAFCEKGIETRTRVVHGPAVEAIINTAEDESADLVAVAGQDRTGWSRGACGCVGACVLNHVDWPLLFLRSSNGG